MEILPGTRSNSVLPKEPLYHPISSRRTKSSTHTPVPSSRPNSVLCDKQLTARLAQAKVSYRSSSISTQVVTTQHALVTHLRVLQETASRSQKTAAVVSLLRSLAEEEGFYQQAMVRIAVQLEKDLLCSLHSLPAEVLREFQKYDQDLERSTDKVPYYAIVEALGIALKRQSDNLENECNQHRLDTANYREEVKMRDEEMRSLKEQIAAYESRPVSYETVYRKLQQDYAKTVVEVRTLRAATFTRKSKFKAMKLDLESIKETAAEQQTRIATLQRDITQLETEKDWVAAKLATTRDILVRRELTYNESQKTNKILKTKLQEMEKHSSDLNRDFAAAITAKDPTLTPRPDWSICPWRSDEKERQGKSSVELLEELVRLIEIGRVKLIRKKSLTA